MLAMGLDELPKKNPNSTLPDYDLVDSIGDQQH
jgi:hypothetical protein